MRQDSLLSCSRLAQRCFSAEEDDEVDPRIRLSFRSGIIGSRFAIGSHANDWGKECLKVCD